MKRFLILALLVVLFSLAVLPASAGVNGFTGSFTSSNPTMATSFHTACSDYGSSGSFRYSVYTVNVTAAGDYDYYDIGYYDGDSSTLDIMVGFFTSFNPANPLAGCVDSGDDNTAITLSAGNYTMVVVTYSESGPTGPWTFSLTGPGTVSIIPTVSNCPVPLPAGSTVRNVPLGAPTYYAADAGTLLTWSLPAGNWWITTTSGDFARVWISCQASQFWIPISALG